jgi:hypothetical protein
MIRITDVTKLKNGDQLYDTFNGYIYEINHIGYHSITSFQNMNISKNLMQVNSITTWMDFLQQGRVVYYLPHYIKYNRYKNLYSELFWED